MLAKRHMPKIRKPIDNAPLVATRYQFHCTLAAERNRADRNGHVFSLLSIESLHPKHRNYLDDIVIPLIFQRIRSCDVMGWLDDDILGVLLPETPASGAWKLIQDIFSKIPKFKVMFAITVYSYPSEGQLLDDGEKGSRKNTTRTPAGTFAHPNLAADTHQPVFRLETLYGCGMPFWKRALDLVGATCGLIILAPLFLAITILIKLVSPGPVFHKQRRIGYLGRPFTFWKFRTMHPNVDSSGHRKYMSHLIHNDIPMVKLDPVDTSRIIPFGTFLRKTCLDELPQLFNVLIGNMSLVGPRPCLPYEAAEYLRWHARRFDNVPGITGLWQVSGKNNITFKEMIRLDIKYANNMSFWLDIKILLKTVPAVISMAINSSPARGETAHVKTA